MYYERKNRATARADHAMELLNAIMQEQRDLLEYTAMMADVELPTAEAETEGAEDHE